MCAASLFAHSGPDLAFRIGYVFGFLALPLLLLILVIFLMVWFRALRRAMLIFVAVALISELAMVLLGGRSRRLFTAPASEAPARAEADAALPAEAPEARSEAMLAWNRRTLEGAYEKVGKKDPRWDKQARVALDAAARNFSFIKEPGAGLADVHAATRSGM